MEVINLKKSNISEKDKCFIIGEAGINHDGSLKKSFELVDVAVEAKVDAVKFQMFNTEKYISDDSFYASYMKKGLISKREKIDEFFKYGKSKGVDFRPFFVPLSSLPFFEKNKSNENSYKLFQNGVNLPSFHDMNYSDCEIVVEIVKEYIKTI